MTTSNENEPQQPIVIVEVPQSILDGLRQTYDEGYAAGHSTGIEQGRSEVTRVNEAQVSSTRRQGFEEGSSEQRQYFLGILKDLQAQHPEITSSLPLDVLELPDRPRNIIERRLGIKTLGELTLKTADELLAEKLFGYKSLDEVQERLAKQGLRLAPKEIPIGEGAVLREVYPSDSQAMFDLIDRNRPHLSQHGDDTAKKYPTIEKMTERNENQTDYEYRFNIWDGDVNVGFAKLTRHAGMPIEVGYYLGAEFQGKGYATKAVAALTDYAIESLHFGAVMAKVAKTNNASLAVLQRAGFVITGEDKANPDDYILTFNARIAQ